MRRKLVSLVVGAAMALSMVACSTQNNTDVAVQSSDMKDSDGAGVSISILNSKTEIQTQFEEMAQEYEEKHGVHVEVYNADTDTTVASQIATKYASHDPYTLTMVDPKDIYAIANDYAYDLSDQDWAGHTSLGIKAAGKLAGFPVCVEARGIIYNADAIEKITGEEFDPSSVAKLEDFQKLLDKLVQGGMEKPVGILSEYWSLGAHWFPMVYEEQQDPEAFVNSLLEGSCNLSENEKYNSMMDTFDTLIKYNYAKGSASNADREETSMKLAEGEIAFMFGGNWDWSVINQYDYTEKLGIMPVPQNTTDGTNFKIVGGATKYFFVDSSADTSDAERQAALDFLNWIVNDKDGNAFLTEKCALVPAFDNIEATSLDPLSLSVKTYADAGNLIPTYNYLPDDHMTVVGQEIMQKYLDEAMDRTALADSVVEYFKTAKGIAH